MEQTNTTEAAVPATRPQFLTVLCILSYIGSGLWALLSLVGIFASGTIMGMLGMGAASAMEQADTTGMSQEQIDAIQSMQSAGGGFMAMLSSYLIIIFIVSLILAGLSLFGVIKMWKLKKSGFWMYAIVNGVLAILGLISGGIFGAVVGIAFIVMYGLNLKHMS